MPRLGPRSTLPVPPTRSEHQPSRIVYAARRIEVAHDANGLNITKRRLTSKKRAVSTARVVRLKRALRPGPITDGAPSGLLHELHAHASGGSADLHIEIPTVDEARKYVFEINSDSGHIAQLRYRDMLGHAPLRLTARLMLPPGRAWIEARQAGALPALHTKEQARRIGPQPFRVRINERGGASGA